MSQTWGADRARSLLHRVRVRVIASIIGAGVIAWGAFALAPVWAALPILGVAVAAVTMTINSLTGRLTARTCWTCGSSLEHEPVSEHGIACPSCGCLNQHIVDPRELPRLPGHDDHFA